MAPKEIQEKRTAFCKHLSTTAKERKITQDQLAEKTGMTQSVINRLFSGKTSPTLDSLIIVADALEIEITLTNLQ